MVPKTIDPRLSISMQPLDMNWQISGSKINDRQINDWQANDWQINEQPAVAVAFQYPKELKLKLSLETRNCGDVVIVLCQGRIVYRDEAAELSRVAGEVLQQARHLVLDLSGVSAMDSAGIGELALLQTWAERKSVNVKYAGATPLVRRLLELTNLNSVLEVHPSLDAALASFREEQICADC
jgi:anti-sigma B factor antagonist